MLFATSVLLSLLRREGAAMVILKKTKENKRKLCRGILTKKSPMAKASISCEDFLVSIYDAKERESNYLSSYIDR